MHAATSEDGAAIILKTGILLKNLYDCAWVV